MSTTTTFDDIRAHRPEDTARRAAMRPSREFTHRYDS